MAKIMYDAGGGSDQKEIVYALIGLGGGVCLMIWRFRGRVRV